MARILTGVFRLPRWRGLIAYKHHWRRCPSFMEFQTALTLLHIELVDTLKRYNGQLQQGNAVGNWCLQNLSHKEFYMTGDKTPATIASRDNQILSPASPCLCSSVTLDSKLYYGCCLQGVTGSAETNGEQVDPGLPPKSGPRKPLAPIKSKPSGE